MVTLINRANAGPDLHCAVPLALWEFLLDLSAKYGERPNKSLTILARGP